MMLKKSGNAIPVKIGNCLRTRVHCIGGSALPLCNGNPSVHCQYFQELVDNMFKKTALFNKHGCYYCKKCANMKPVQDCTGFIFCTFRALNCTGFIFCTFHALDCTGSILCTFPAVVNL